MKKCEEEITAKAKAQKDSKEDPFIGAPLDYISEYLAEWFDVVLEDRKAEALEDAKRDVWSSVLELLERQYEEPGEEYDEWAEHKNKLMKKVMTKTTIKDLYEAINKTKFQDY